VHPVGYYCTDVQNFFYIIILLRIWQTMFFILRKTTGCFEVTVRIVRMY